MGDIQSGEIAPVARRGYCLGNGSTYSDTCGTVNNDMPGWDQPLWYAEFAEYKMTQNTTSEGLYFAIVVHIVIALMLLIRLYSWWSDKEARSFNRGGYLRFCIAYERTLTNRYTVYAACVCGMTLAIAALFVIEDDHPFSVLGVGLLLVLIGLKALLSTPDVVLDIDTPEFINAKFKWTSLWISGCDYVAVALGPPVAMGDTDKIYSFLDNDGSNVDPGFTLIGPPLPAAVETEAAVELTDLSSV